MTDTMNQALHADHRHWLSNLSFWKDDLEEWRKELSRAADEIRRVENVMKSHAQGIERHAVQLKDEERAVREHETGIALVERSQTGWDAEDHVQDTAYSRLRNAHERLKKYHHTVMARVSLLLKAVEEAV